MRRQISKVGTDNIYKGFEKMKLTVRIELKDKIKLGMVQENNELNEIAFIFKKRIMQCNIIILS